MNDLAPIKQIENNQVLGEIQRLSINFNSKSDFLNSNERQFEKYQEGELDESLIRKSLISPVTFKLNGEKGYKIKSRQSTNINSPTKQQHLQQNLNIILMNNDNQNQSLNMSSKNIVPYHQRKLHDRLTQSFGGGAQLYNQTQKSYRINDSNDAGSSSPKIFEKQFTEGFNLQAYQISHKQRLQIREQSHDQTQGQNEYLNIVKNRLKVTNNQDQYINQATTQQIQSISKRNKKLKSRMPKREQNEQSNLMPNALSSILMLTSPAKAKQFVNQQQQHSSNNGGQASPNGSTKIQNNSQNATNISSLSKIQKPLVYQAKQYQSSSVKRSSIQKSSNNSNVNDGSFKMNLDSSLYILKQGINTTDNKMESQHIHQMRQRQQSSNPRGASSKYFNTSNQKLKNQDSTQSVLRQQQHRSFVMQNSDIEKQKQNEISVSNIIKTNAPSQNQSQVQGREEHQEHNQIENINQISEQQLNLQSQNLTVHSHNQSQLNSVKQSPNQSFRQKLPYQQNPVNSQISQFKPQLYNTHSNKKNDIINQNVESKSVTQNNFYFNMQNSQNSAKNTYKHQSFMLSDIKSRYIDYGQNSNQTSSKQWYIVPQQQCGGVVVNILDQNNTHYTHQFTMDSPLKSTHKLNKKHKTGNNEYINMSQIRNNGKLSSQSFYIDKTNPSKSPLFVISNQSTTNEVNKFIEVQRLDLKHYSPNLFGARKRNSEDRRLSMGSSFINVKGSNINDNQKDETSTEQLFFNAVNPKFYLSVSSNMFVGGTGNNTTKSSNHANLSAQQATNQEEQNNFNFINSKQSLTSNVSTTEEYKQQQQYYLKFIVTAGNNSQLIRYAFNRRNFLWKETHPSDLSFHLKWQPTSQGLRYNQLGQNIYDQVCQKQLINHLEFHSQISEKSKLFLNMSKFALKLKENVFDYMPITFFVEIDSLNIKLFNMQLMPFSNFYYALEDNKKKVLKFYSKLRSSSKSQRDPQIAFDKYFYQYFSSQKQRKDSQKQKAGNDQYIMTLKNQESLNPASHPNNQCSPRTISFDLMSQKSQNLKKFYMPFCHFTGHNLWLLKPTKLNRGRGIHVCNNISTLKSLINQYCEGFKKKSIIIASDKVQRRDSKQSSKNILSNPQSPVIKEINKNQIQNKNQITDAKSTELEAKLDVQEQDLTKNTNKVTLQQTFQQETTSYQSIRKQTVQNLTQKQYKIKHNSFIIQKYLEKPLLIHERKFDVRVWVLINYDSSVYMFKEGYLRTSSSKFNIDPNNPDDQFVHLTNNAIQKYSENYGNFEDGNQMSYQQFQDYLNAQKNSSQNSESISVLEEILFKFKQLIIRTIFATRNQLESKSNLKHSKQVAQSNCFELFGYDFIMDEDFNVFLIEVNTNPCIEESSRILKKYIPRMIDDMLKISVDQYFKDVSIPQQQQESQQSATNTYQEILDKNKSSLSVFPINGYDDSENLWEFLVNMNDKVSRKEAKKMYLKPIEIKSKYGFQVKERKVKVFKYEQRDKSHNQVKKCNSSRRKGQAE